MNDSQEIISIIMPVWKTKTKLLKESIKSIIEQTYDNFEFIIIHEKSNETIDIEIEKIFVEFEDNRIKIIKVNEGGLTNSLNIGIQNSRGKYIARMDSDDISDSHRLEKQLEYIKKNNLDLVGTWAYSILEEGTIIGKIKMPITHSEIRKKIMFHNPFLHPTILFKKSIIQKVGQYDLKYNGAEDYQLYFKIISENFKVGNIPEYLLKLRETKDSVMRGKKWRYKRKIYFDVKKNAVKCLGFNKPRDLFYFFFTPLVFLISPKLAFYIKKYFGYNK